MKWIPLSERKPNEPIVEFTMFCNSNGLICVHCFGSNKIPDDATHWLEIPPLPKPENPKDPDQFYRGKRLPQELIDIAGVCDELKGKPKDADVNEFSIRYPYHAEKPKDPDWKILSGNYSRWLKDKISKDEFITQIYEFLKAKYDSNQ